MCDPGKLSNWHLEQGGKSQNYLDHLFCFEALKTTPIEANLDVIARKNSLKNNFPLIKNYLKNNSTRIKNNSPQLKIN